MKQLSYIKKIKQDHHKLWHKCNLYEKSVKKYFNLTI